MKISLMKQVIKMLKNAYVTHNHRTIPVLVLYCILEKYLKGDNFVMLQTSTPTNMFLKNLGFKVTEDNKFIQKHNASLISWESK